MNQRKSSSFILTINGGSSSIKFALFQAEDPSLPVTANEANQPVISSEASRVRVHVIPTDEEHEIAESVALLRSTEKMDR